MNEQINRDVSYNMLDCRVVEEAFSKVNVVTCSQYSQNQHPTSSSGSGSGSNITSSSSGEKNGFWEPWMTWVAVGGGLLLVLVAIIVVVLVKRSRGKERSGYSPINGSS